MINDPIFEELSQFRENYAAKFNYDLDAIFDDLKRKETKNGHQVVSFLPKPYKPPVKNTIVLDSIEGSKI
jgi:hypothetical protein